MDNDSKYRWHRKPKGVKGPCPICKCPSKYLRAEHRSRTKREMENTLDGFDYLWICWYVHGYGMDSEFTLIRKDGLRDRNKSIYFQEEDIDSLFGR